jgi:hypothetical protein
MKKGALKFNYFTAPLESIAVLTELTNAIIYRPVMYN